MNEKTWIHETRMYTMSNDQAEIFCAIQSKKDALLRKSVVQDNLKTGKHLKLESTS